MIQRHSKMILLLLALFCSTSMNAMSNGLCELNDINSGDRSLLINFSHQVFTLNKRSIPIEDSGKAVSQVASIFHKRYTYLQSLFLKNYPASISWYFKAQYMLVEEMENIGRFLWMYQHHIKEYITSGYLHKKCHVSITQAFTRLLNVFENLHTLRTSACRELIVRDVRPEVLSKALAAKAIENSFQQYFNAVNSQVDVTPWFERMRDNDICEKLLLQKQ